MTITVSRDQSGTMRHLVQIGRHQLSVDEPIEAGGEDSGPNPHDLYDSALGACKALTVLWYAQKKGIPVEDVRVTVERDATGEKDGVYKLRTLLEVTGPLSTEQRERLLAVAGKCPVHKLMSQVRTEIETDWK